MLLHAGIIALALISFAPRPTPQASEQGVSVVFDNGGTQATTAPPAPLQGALTQAQAPPPSPPPPPQPQAQPQPQVNLDMPVSPFAQLSLPAPQPQPSPQQPSQRPVRNARRVPPHPQYQVMNNMSLGTGAPSMPSSRRGLNLQLDQSDLNALNAPQIQVEGNIGQDWIDGFNKWVNAHTYYPQEAVENNQQGTSVIQFTVHRDGSITGLHLLRSAGSPFLDQAWLNIFAQNNVPPFPPGTKSDTIKITYTLQYELIP